MAIAFRQNGGVVQSTSATTTATTAAFNTQINDVVAVQVAIHVNTSTVSTVTDLAGNTYVAVAGASINSTNGRIETWQTTATVANASNTVTVTISAGAKFVVEASSYSGVAAIGASGSSTSAAANPTQSLTTQDNNNFVVAGFSGRSTGTFTVSTGNNRGNGVTSGGGATTNQGGAQGDNTSATPASTTVAYTNTDTEWAMGILELRTVAPAVVQLGWHQPFSLPRDEIVGIVAN